MAERRRTAGRRGRPTRQRTAAEREEIRRAAARQVAALKARDTRRRRRREITPPPPPPPAFAFFRIPDQNGRLWRWLIAQGERRIWATTLCAEGDLVHLWQDGGWRADWVLRRVLLSYGGPDGLQEFFRDQADENTVSPCDHPIIGVTVGRAVARRAA